MLQYLSRVEAESRDDEDGMRVSQDDHIHTQNGSRVTTTATNASTTNQQKVAAGLDIRRPHRHRYGTSVPVKFYNPARKTESLWSDSYIKSIQTPIRSPYVPPSGPKLMDLDSHHHSVPVENANSNGPPDMQLRGKDIECQTVVLPSGDTENSGEGPTSTSSRMKAVQNGMDKPPASVQAGLSMSSVNVIPKDGKGILHRDS